MQKDKRNNTGLNRNRIHALYHIKGYNVEESAEKMGVSMWSLYDFMRKNGIPRRSASEANYLVHRDKPQFSLTQNLGIAQQTLKIAGIMLYWAEGTLKGNTVDLANSDPRMIRLFLKFLREICGVDERRLRIYLYAHSYADVGRLKSYWHAITQVPLCQFTKPYVRKGSQKLSTRKMLYGLIHVRYNDTRLLHTIEQWINEYIDELSLGRCQSGQMDQTVANAASRRNP